MSFQIWQEFGQFCSKFLGRKKCKVRNKVQTSWHGMKRIEFRQVKVVSRLIDYVVDQQIWVDKILCKYVIEFYMT